MKKEEEEKEEKEEEEEEEEKEGEERKENWIWKLKQTLIYRYYVVINLLIFNII